MVKAEKLVNKGTLSVKELAIYIGCGENAAYELVKSKGFPILRLGRKIYIPKVLLDEWITKQVNNVC